MRMHADQIDLTVGAVPELVAGQFPAWAARPVRPVASDGTVNALFRLGDDIVLRFPLRPAARAELVEEQEHARRIAAQVALEVPEPRAIGEPGPGYPGPWSCLADADVRPVWIHADLMPGNLLVRGGRLAAVIDLGAVTVGDPAVDLMPAWNLLTAEARSAYRAALGVDDAAWARGRGWALVQAIVALPYYVDTNPGMAANARHTLDALLTG
jgi:aminoglycoside phosphotransferase (APT) family kinase protein